MESTHSSNISQALDNPPSSNIVLFGFMGAGKTTIARELSLTYGFKMIETDSLVVKSSGISVEEIFEKHGVNHFRILEAYAVKSLERQSGLVISTGGGVIENRDNYVSLTQNGVPFILSCSFDILWDRIQKDSTVRPLAQSYDELLQLFIKRKSLYNAIVNSVPTEGIAVKEIAALVYHQFLSLGGLAPLN